MSMLKPKAYEWRRKSSQFPSHQQVFDCRQLSTPSQMFDALCNHLKYSTNKGNLRWENRNEVVWVEWPRTCFHSLRSATSWMNEIEFVNLICRSAITIFPQRTDGKHDFRIWNPQVTSFWTFDLFFPSDFKCVFLVLSWYLMQVTRIQMERS